MLNVFIYNLCIYHICCFFQSPTNEPSPAPHSQLVLSLDQNRRLFSPPIFRLSFTLPSSFFKTKAYSFSCYFNRELFAFHLAVCVYFILKEFFCYCNRKFKPPNSYIPAVQRYDATYKFFIDDHIQYKLRTEKVKQKANE